MSKNKTIKQDRVPKAPKVFDFQEQIAKGKKGEEAFIMGYHSSLSVVKDHFTDFVRSDGIIVELKTDYYDHDKTANFFIERYSSYEAKSPGSFWQSQAKGVQMLCYLFASHGIYYEFADIPATIARLEEIIPGLSYIRVPNKGWTGVGYRIPREVLKDLYTVHVLRTPDKGKA